MNGLLLNLFASDFIQIFVVFIGLVIIFIRST